MPDLVRLKQHVCRLSDEPRFIHHQWFVAHHLNIIEQIVEELLTRYPQADADICRAMIWVHDWGKILTNKGTEEEESTRHEITHTLPDFGFTAPQIKHIHAVYDEMESLKPAGPDFLIETKIISSADGLSHYVGPFFALYWYENPQKSVGELIADNLHKATRDEKKILLAEVGEAAKARIAALRENAAQHRPSKYL
jgi:hypothetical protein